MDTHFDCSEASVGKNNYQQRRKKPNFFLTSLHINAHGPTKASASERASQPLQLRFLGFFNLEHSYSFVQPLRGTRTGQQAFTTTVNAVCMQVHYGFVASISRQCLIRMCDE